MTHSRSAFFVSGTGTEIGKTYCSRLLCDCFAESSSVTYFKPVQSGCEEPGERTTGVPDFDFVMAGKARSVDSLDTHVPYRFQPACSPHLAAEMQSTLIDPAVMHQAYRRLRTTHQGIIICEGAGGLMVPLTRNYYMLDMIHALDIPAVLVAALSLGTLNHTILSVEALCRKGIPLAGLMLNEYPPHNQRFIHDDNIRTLREYVSPAPTVVVPHNARVNSQLREFCREIIG